VYIEIRNAHSSRMCADAQVSHSMDCGSDSTELQHGHRTSTELCSQTLKCGRGFKCQIGSWWNITPTVVHFVEKRASNIYGICLGCN
jgi:hypothetical protein